MGTNMFKGFGTMMIVTVILTLTIIVPLAKEFLLLLYNNENNLSNVRNIKTKHTTNNSSKKK
jgi:preprotein translocase subunit SecD